MQKLHVKISLKGLMSKCGYHGVNLVKTNRLLDVMSARFGYRMRPEDCFSIQVPTARQVKSRTGNNHPELKRGECFLGNHNVLNGTKLPEHLQGFSTIRLGKKAYDINGYPISGSYMLPLFVHESEYKRYNDVMSARSRLH